MMSKLPCFRDGFRGALPCPRGAPFATGSLLAFLARLGATSSSLPRRRFLWPLSAEGAAPPAALLETSPAFAPLSRMQSGWTGSAVTATTDDDAGWLGLGRGQRRAAQHRCWRTRTQGNAAKYECRTPHCTYTFL